MIKVIKHGHAQYKMTCRYCECVFTFEDSDIENNGSQRDWEEWVTSLNAIGIMNLLREVHLNIINLNN